MKVLVISHLYPSPGVERHLFVHEQLLALRELGVEPHVISPTPYVPRLLQRNERQKRRGEKPREAVRDGITAEYPRFVQPPKRLLFDRLGDIAYRSVTSLPSVTAGEWDLIHAHQALPDGAVAQRLAKDLRVPYVVTVHGADVYQHFRMGGSVEKRAKEVLGAADGVMANSSAVAGLLAGVVAPEKLTVVLNGTTGLGETVEPAADYLPGEPLVLTVGYLIERKGIRDLVAALGLLRRQGRTVHLAVAGDGPLRGALEGAGRAGGRRRLRALPRTRAARARAGAHGARATGGPAELGRGVRARVHRGDGPGHAGRSPARARDRRTSSPTASAATWPRFARPTRWRVSSRRCWTTPRRRRRSAKPDAPPPSS